jgi:hypothetical protein
VLVLVLVLVASGWKVLNDTPTDIK